MTQRLTRCEVPTELTWRLEDLFVTPAAWEAELASLEAALPSLTEYRGRLADGAATLMACIDLQEALQERLIRIATYASLRLSADGGDPVGQADYERAAGLGARAEAAMAFIKSEILALPTGTVELWITAHPPLASLKHHLEKMLATRVHQLTPETEVALAALGEVHSAPYLIYERAKSSDMQFDRFADGQGQERELSFALYEDACEGSADTATRRNAYATFAQGLTRYQNTFGATFATEVKKQVVLARLRGYPSATQMLLQPHEVSLTAYHNVLDIIQAEVAPHMRRYAALRKRVLGLDKLLYCDVEAPLDPAYNPQIGFSEASDLIVDALSVMGPEYGRILRRALGERWIDLAENVGKSTGAFCTTPYGCHSYILITWTGTMRGCFVLAHELGHAGHFELANRRQRMLNTDPSMFFVEAPSTLNELLVGQHILAQSKSPQMRRWVIMKLLATYHHNFVRHLLEGELQRQIFALAEEGVPVTAALLSETKGAILAEFWGGAVEIDAGARLTWMRQPHYYMGLYPYTYAAGLTLATAVAQRIFAEGEPAAARWLEVLEAGGTLGPLELAEMAGVDMSQPDPIRKAVAYVGSLVDELERSFAEVR